MSNIEWQAFAARALDIAERAVAVMEAREARIGSGLAFERDEGDGTRTSYRDGKVTRDRNDEEPAWMPRSENKPALGPNDRVYDKAAFDCTYGKNKGRRSQRTGAGDVPGDIA